MATGRRRGRGEGSIYRRADGRWCAVVDLGFRDGKRARKFFYGTTRREVAEDLAKALRELQQGIIPADERIILTDWVTRYLDDMEARGAIRQTTLVHYRGILRNYLAPSLGHRRVAQLQPQHVQSYQTTLLRRGLSANSITVHRALLSGALNEAVSFGLIPRNVVGLVKPPKADAEPKGRAMPPEHARALLNVTAGDRLAVFYLLLLTAGLRRGEALGLCWSDVEHPDGGGGMLNLHRQLQWPEGVPTLVALKSKRSARRIPLPEPTVDALDRRRVQQRHEFAAQGRSQRPTDLVLTTPEGEPVHRTTITKQFQRFLIRADLPPYRLHDLRHSYGSFLMSQGVPLKTIAELMGHSSIEITADVYLHSLEEHVLDTSNAVTRALAPSPTPALPEGICPTCGRPL